MRHPVLDSMKKCMEEEPFSLMPEDGRILAAVSGGADSVCLLLALMELGYDVSAVHVEHGIRGKESLEDCAYVRKLCEERKVDLLVVSVDVPARAGEYSLSMEEAARCARWEAIDAAAEKTGIHVIATAHHQRDQAETVLWNLIRGSSLGGLGGIRPLRRDGANVIIRPLISCERTQMEDYLRQRGVSWRTDSTNSDTAITRNAIRLKILPLLEQLNPGAVPHIASAASDLRQAEAYIREQAEQAYQDVILDDGNAREQDLTADRLALMRYPEVIRSRVLRRMTAQCCGGEKDLSRAHADALNHLVSGKSGHEIFLPKGLRAVSEEGILRLTRRNVEKNEQIVPLDHEGGYSFLARMNPFSEEASAGDSTIHIDVSFLTWRGEEVPKKKYTKYLAYDTMAPYPVLRTRRDGDYLIVNSASGRKKLKDYLIDEKVPRLRRDCIPLIAQGSHILWVIGMRISEGAKVSRGMDAMKVVVTDRSAEG